MRVTLLFFLRFACQLGKHREGRQMSRRSWGEDRPSPQTTELSAAVWWGWQQRKLTGVLLLFTSLPVGCCWKDHFRAAPCHPDNRGSTCSGARREAVSASRVCSLGVCGVSRLISSLC